MAQQVQDFVTKLNSLDLTSNRRDLTPHNLSSGPHVCIWEV